MRITSGIARGHKLKVPKVSDLRPSQDIVRQAIFNILDTARPPRYAKRCGRGHKIQDTREQESKGCIKGTKILDLYAGTGALGIEALSRGATHVDFVDNKKLVCNVISANLNHSRLLGKAKISCRDAERFVKETPPESYDLIFLDPPYNIRPQPVLLRLPEIIRKRGIIVYLHDKRIVLTQDSRALLGKRLKVLDTRKYGRTAVSFLTKRNSSDY